MSKLEQLKLQLKRLLESSPLDICLPDYPWEGSDWSEVIVIINSFVNSNHEVLDEYDPFVEWLEKYRFFKIQSKNQL